jgi:hypothetical protein
LVSYNSLFDFMLPFWVEYVLYAICFLLASGGIIVTALYGADADLIDPTNEKVASPLALRRTAHTVRAQTIAWIESFFISVAVNIVVLQTLQAVLGSVATAVIGGVSTGATALALLVGSTAINIQN